MLGVVCVIAVTLAASPREQWVAQIRAADAVGEAITVANFVAEERVDQLRREVGPSTPKALAGPTTREAQAAYRDALDEVTKEQRRSTDDFSRSAASSDAQLIDELAALQEYNLRAFRRLLELRELDAQMRRVAATTQPAVPTPANVADEAVAALHRAKPDERWLASRRRMRNAIAAKFAAPSTPAPSQINPAVTSYRAVPLDDPRWQPFYYGPGDAFGWIAPGEDAASFEFRGGGGVYQRTDTRVNYDFDTRRQGQFDRRVNVDADRRLNIHVDPRENF